MPVRRIPALNLALILAAFVGCRSSASVTPATTGAPGINWAAAWDWPMMETWLRSVQPEAMPALGALRRAVPLDYARPLLRHLSRLASPVQILRIGDRAAIDRRTLRQQMAPAALRSALRGYVPRSDPRGLLDAALRLAAAREALRDPFVPDIANRTYAPPSAAPLVQPVVRISLDYSLAETLIDRLSSGTTPDSEWNRLADSAPFQEVLRHPDATQLRRCELVGWWQRAQDPDPLNRLYEWVFPGSYYDFGGVAVFADLHRRTIAGIRKAAPQIADRVARRVGRFLPEHIVIDARVNLLFAAVTDGWAAGGQVGLNLEHFGDDYEYLVRVLEHECYHRAQGVMRPNGASARLAADDQTLSEGLLELVAREGMACYVGPSWPGSPSDAEMDAAFASLEQACGALYGRGSRFAHDRQIREGRYMAGWIYKVGFRMAQLIEQKLGLPALVALQSEPPPAMFAAYIAACRRSSLADAPTSQRFSPAVESAVQRIAGGLPTQRWSASHLAPPVGPPHRPDAPPRAAHP